jgi:DHA1 family multidrug resistance protein-like MFS transporter
VLADISAPHRRGRNIATYQTAFLFGFGVGPIPGGLIAAHYGLSARFLATGVTSLVVSGIAWLLVSETRPAIPATSHANAAPPPAFFRQVVTLLSCRGFLLVSLISLMNAVVRTGGLFALIPLLVTATRNLSVAEIGFAMMLGSICGLVAAYPAGWINDRHGRKAVIVPSTFLTGTSMALFCYAPTYAWFIAASIIWNVAASISSSAPAVYAADSAGPGMNAAAMSTYRMTADADYIIGPLRLGLLADITSPAAAIIAAAALLVLIGALFGLAAPESRRTCRTTLIVVSRGCVHGRTSAFGTLFSYHHGRLARPFAKVQEININYLIAR